MLHVNYTIDRKAPDHNAARFTVHRDKNADTQLQGVDLDQAYPDRLTAVHAVLDAIEAHMARRYNLGPNEITIEEK
jgi:hypothetical protein